MRKLIQGILEFRTKCRKEYLSQFGHLAKRQSPDALLIACSDSRVVPNIFASTDPGDVFVIRNMGNIIPAFIPSSPSSEAAALHFSLESLPVKDIIICGHSDCGAMHALANGTTFSASPMIKDWLSLACCSPSPSSSSHLPLHDQLSQQNILQQIEHLKTYPIVQKRLQEGSLTIHGWYFDLAKADVYNFEEKENRFVLIDEEEAISILQRLK